MHYVLKHPDGEYYSRTFDYEGPRDSYTADIDQAAAFTLQVPPGGGPPVLDPPLKPGPASRPALTLVAVRANGRTEL